MSDEIRRYGYFDCGICGNQWQSAHVYCYEYGYLAIDAQDCRECGEETWPSKVEKLRCSICGNKENCCCNSD